MQKSKVVPFLPLYTKNNSRWVIDLNVRAKTVKLLEENLGVGLCDLELSKAFLGKTYDNRKNKLGFIKTKNFCTSRNTIKK